MYRPVGGKISSYQGFVNGKNIKPIDQSSDEDDKPPPLPLWDRCEHIRSLIKVMFFQSLPWFVCEDLQSKKLHHVAKTDPNFNQIFQYSSGVLRGAALLKRTILELFDSTAILEAPLA